MFSFHRVIQTERQKETVLMLIFSRVKRQDFHDYHFHAHNDIGRTSHVVRLIRRHPSPTNSTGKILLSATK